MTNQFNRDLNKQTRDLDDQQLEGVTGGSNELNPEMKEELEIPIQDRPHNIDKFRPNSKGLTWFS